MGLLVCPIMVCYNFLLQLNGNIFDLVNEVNSTEANGTKRTYLVGYEDKETEMQQICRRLDELRDPFYCFTPEDKPLALINNRHIIYKVCVSVGCYKFLDDLFSSVEFSVQNQLTLASLTLEDGLASTKSKPDFVACVNNTPFIIGECKGTGSSTSKYPYHLLADSRDKFIILFFSQI